MNSLTLSLGDDEVHRIAVAVVKLLHSSALAATTAHPQSDRPARLTVAEAAKELRCSDRQIRRLIAGGNLRAAKLGTGSSRVLIDRFDLERMVREAGASR